MWMVTNSNWGGERRGDFSVGVRGTAETVRGKNVAGRKALSYTPTWEKESGFGGED